MAFWDEIEPGWNTGTAYDEPRTPDTVTADLATSRQAVDTSGTGSIWNTVSDAFGKVLNAGVQTYTAKSQLQLQQQQRQALATQPLVTASNGTFAVNPTLLLIGGVVLAAVLLGRKG